MNLHPIHGRAIKCGPSALSAISGLSTDHCAKAIRTVTGKRMVNGVSDHTMQATLSLLGYDAAVTHLPHRPCLGPWLNTLHTIFATRPQVAVIASVSNHYIVFAPNQVIDNGHFFCTRALPIKGNSLLHALRLRHVVSFIEVHVPSTTS